LKHIEVQGLTPEWILDTHPHADHFSAAGYLKDMTGTPTGIGERVVQVQKLWKEIYNLPDSTPVDGSQWDRLFADGERFTVGEMEVAAAAARNWWSPLSEDPGQCFPSGIVGLARHLQSCRELRNRWY